ncbi:hypothetical protein [Methylomonas sp. AM2-LC]|uniref:hypothetical protein n=1 Tax=Methylomonas sp. AM2-LC TaxID=3153301 RepID=UPI003265F64B
MDSQNAQIENLTHNCQVLVACLKNMLLARLDSDYIILDDVMKNAVDVLIHLDQSSLEKYPSIIKDMNVGYDWTENGYYGDKGVNINSNQPWLRSIAYLIQDQKGHDLDKKPVDDIKEPSPIDVVIQDLTTAFQDTPQGTWTVEPHGHFVIDQSDVNLNEVVQIMNKGSAFTTNEGDAVLHFVAASHNAFPALSDEIKRLKSIEGFHKELNSYLLEALSVMTELRMHTNCLLDIYPDNDIVSNACSQHDLFSTTFQKYIDRFNLT